MTYIQFTGYGTTHPGEMDALTNERVTATEGKRTSTHEMHTQHRDHPGRYMGIIEFPPYDPAMRNSKPPQTQRISGTTRERCPADRLAAGESARTGCTGRRALAEHRSSDTHEQAKRLSDEIALKSSERRHEMRGPTVAAAWLRLVEADHLPVPTG